MTTEKQAHVLNAQDYRVIYENCIEAGIFTAVTEIESIAMNPPEVVAAQWGEAGMAIAAQIEAYTGDAYTR